MMPPTQRPLTMTERRDLKRQLGTIADALRALDVKERHLDEQRQALRDEQARLNAQVYRS